MPLPFEVIEVPRNRALEVLRAPPPEEGTLLLIKRPELRDLAEEAASNAAALIAAAEAFDFTAWLYATGTISEEEREAELLISLAMGALPAEDDPTWSPMVHDMVRRRRAVDGTPDAAMSKEEKELIGVARALKEARDDPGTDLATVQGLVERLMSPEAKPHDPFRSLHLMSQLFGGEAVAALTGGTASEPDTPDAAAPLDPLSTMLGTASSKATLARLPAPHPWAAPAYLPGASYMAGDSRTALLAFCRHLHIAHGARPITASTDSLGFNSPTPPPLAEAARIALGFQALGASEINGIPAAQAAETLASASSWLVWWD
ncbi:DUF4253 domain-containing protein [Vannielia litorea]|uniref:DUF4253 domain-containing protein n=1 Tax=Vannielia litorea TaxID=1217970 RepID=UPI001C96E34B|nr:DUF4253 domain-containing protein [Vannielia litorea]MBY6048832.1 DUF4253 domain-containing protein [Vannielia litorea]MBY6076246.1 DUF4253 domain-containing protein [Vannielia litorea]